MIRKSRWRRNNHMAAFVTLLLLWVTAFPVNLILVSVSTQLVDHISYPHTEKTIECTRTSEKSECGNQETRPPWWENWLRDKNRDKIDDSIEDDLGPFNILVQYDRHPATSDVTLLSTYINVSNIYDCIDCIAARDVPGNVVENLTRLPHVVMIKRQDLAEPALDISVPAVKARQSEEYSPNTAWDLGYTGERVTIAILDTGVDNEHESFSGKFVAGYDATRLLPYEGDPDDTDGHGTHVAGIALGTGGSDQTYMGVAPGAKLVDVKILPGHEAEILEGIDWVMNNTDKYDISIMSMSIRMLDANENEINSNGAGPINDAVNAAVDAGIVVIACVGNSGNNIITIPAAADKAIAVGATNDWGEIDRSQQTIATFSNYGPRLDDGDDDQIDELKPDVVAPGDFILAPQWNTTNKYRNVSGTSQAAPLVSGIVALMLEKDQKLTPTQVKDILRKTADDRNGAYNPTLDPKYDVKWGWGLVDAYEALKLTGRENSTISSHFSVYYNTTGPNGTTHEYAQAVNDALAHSWTTIVTTFGFDSPDLHITAYLEDLPFHGKTSSYYGPPAWHVDFVEIDIGMEMGLAKAIAAREFFHIIQLSYDHREEDWIINGTAKWSESKVYPEYTGPFSYVEYANSFMSNPNRTLTQLSYDSVLFWTYLEENHGGPATIESIMEQTKTRNGINAVDAALNTLSTSFAEAFKEWTTANYLKDRYYSNSHLFNPVPSAQLPTYGGTIHTLNENVSDWGTNYYEIDSSVIYMPILFESKGKHSHNLTKILIEHDLPLISDFPINSTYFGSFLLMQAYSLDKVVIIVCSFGDETSSDVVPYTLSFPASSCTLKGPFSQTSSATTMIVTETTGTHLSSTLTLTAVGKSSSQTSSALALAVTNKSGSQGSSLLKIATANGSSTQKSSPRNTAVVSRSSSQNSSETPLNVVLPDLTGPGGVPDGIVDVYDLAFLGKAYGTEEGDPNWDEYAVADITGPDGLPDGMIDRHDVELLRENYGKVI